MEKSEYVILMNQNPARMMRRLQRSRVLLAFTLSLLGSTTAILALVFKFRLFINVLGYTPLLNLCMIFNFSALWYSTSRMSRVILTRLLLDDETCKIGQLIQLQDGSGRGIVCCRKHVRGDGSADYWFCQIAIPKRRWVTRFKVYTVTVICYTFAN
jgi:hypothetical protein